MRHQLEDALKQTKAQVSKAIARVSAAPNEIVSMLWELCFWHTAI